MDATPIFTRAGVLAGARRTFPLALSVFAVGTAFGVLARQAGLTLAESLLMSALVFAGAAQFIALSLWATPLPVVALIATTLIVNLRHLLMGATLRPWFAGVSRFKTYASIFFMVDESWAVSTQDQRAGGKDSAFLLGSGLALWLSWLAATSAGFLLGASIRNPTTWGLDFAFVAAFSALLTRMWMGKQNLIPWAVSAAVAVAGSHLLQGKWYILLGALAGSVVGAILHAD